MTNEIPRHSWKMFFDDLTKRRFDWKTKIEIFNDEIGNQILDQGLPFAGITCENRGDEVSVEIFVGTDDDHHQTHTIKNPTKIAYLGEEEKPGGIVEIEEADGTKTLVHIVQPMPLVVSYAENQEANTA
jgi:hypothetical protein